MQSKEPVYLGHGIRVIIDPNIDDPPPWRISSGAAHDDQCRRLAAADVAAFGFSGLEGCQQSPRQPLAA